MANPLHRADSRAPRLPRWASSMAAAADAAVARCLISVTPRPRMTRPADLTRHRKPTPWHKQLPRRDQLVTVAVVLAVAAILWLVLAR
jgi:hypothetical protein